MVSSTLLLRPVSTAIQTSAQHFGTLLSFCMHCSIVLLLTCFYSLSFLDCAKTWPMGMIPSPLLAANEIVHFASRALFASIPMLPRDDFARPVVVDIGAATADISEDTRLDSQQLVASGL